MNNLLKELEEIKNKKMNALERTIIFKSLAKKYNMFHSDICDIYYNFN